MQTSDPPTGQAIQPSQNGHADPDPQETQEWLEALDGVLAREGPARTKQLVERVVERAQTSGAHVALNVQTPYVNTIPVARQPKMPGNDELETRLRHYIRWNAMAMVVRANEASSELGGHVASFASSATLYDVGFNHFFRAPSETFGGDLVFFQGHS
ncbi:MAG: pyruvate dehydrogenase (acetyl-transferring), homodimeric type, partial [Candidatus Eremiobacteraeota bacterium]|nr:pyruvate dehydrogenase (acetyl-transferring), homodimeric type [Candidatus Eremiobacteraeota bacterium]